MTLTMGTALAVGLIVKRTFWWPVAKFYIGWIVVYCLFIILTTGPVGDRLYALPTTSPYKLPWKAGVSRFVSQGNRSFTSHRDLHFYAWDFWMAIGTEVLAARAGAIIRIEQILTELALNQIT